MLVIFNCLGLTKDGSIWFEMHISVYCKEDKTMAYPMYFNVTWYDDVFFVAQLFVSLRCIPKI